MRLFTASWSPNGRRVNVFLAEKGVSLPTVEVDLTKSENLAEAFRARNPFGRVPVLELDDGTHLSESIAISRYVEALHPTPPLFGVDARDQAVVEMWNRRAEFNFLMPVVLAFRNTHPFFKGREPVVAEYGAVAEQQAAQALPLFDDRLRDSRYVAGERFTVADVTLATAFEFAKATRRELPFDLPNVARWFAEVSARASFVR